MLQSGFSIFSQSTFPAVRDSPAVPHASPHPAAEFTACSSVSWLKKYIFYFSSSSPSLMLLREAEAAFGEEGGEALLKTQGGDGERDGERPRVGLLLGLCRGEKAWSIRPLRSWNICFCKSKVKRCSLSNAQRGKVCLWAGRGCAALCLSPGREQGDRG